MNVIYSLPLFLLTGLATLLSLVASLHLISLLFILFSRSLTKRLNKTICSTVTEIPTENLPAGRHVEIQLDCGEVTAASLYDYTSLFLHLLKLKDISWKLN